MYMLDPIMHHAGHNAEGDGPCVITMVHYAWYLFMYPGIYEARLITHWWLSDANMRHEIILIFGYQIWNPREISIRMNGNMTM